MKLKKIITITSIISTLLLTSCSNDPDCSSIEENSISQTISLQNKSVELAQEIDMLASNSEYVNSISLSSELNAIISKIASQDYDNPTDIYKFSGIDSSYKTVMQYVGIETPDFDNDKLTELYKDKLLHSLPMQLNAMSGTDIIAGTAMLTTEDIFLYSDLTEREVYLLLYDGDFNVIVLFSPQGEGIVKASANIVTHEMLTEIQADGDISGTMKLGISFAGISLEKLL